MSLYGSIKFGRSVEKKYQKAEKALYKAGSVSYMLDKWSNRHQDIIIVTCRNQVYSVLETVSSGISKAPKKLTGMLIYKQTQ